MATDIATLAASQSALLSAMASARSSISTMFEAAMATPSLLGTQWETITAQAKELQAQANAYMIAAAGNVTEADAWKTQILTDAQTRANDDLERVLSEGDQLASLIVATFVFDPSQYPQEEFESDAEYVARLSEAAVRANDDFIAWRIRAMADTYAQLLSDFDGMTNELTVYQGWIAPRPVDKDAIAACIARDTAAASGPDAGEAL